MPDDVRDRVTFQPGERVLAAASTGAGGHVVASDRALYLIGDDVRRVRWDLIDHARWQPPMLRFTVWDPDSDTVSAQAVPVDQTSDLPATVRNRVTDSFLVNLRLDVPGGSARILARRDTDSGRLVWRTLTEPRGLRHDPAVQAVLVAETAAVRSRMGI